MQGSGKGREGERNSIQHQCIKLSPLPTHSKRTLRDHASEKLCLLTLSWPGLMRSTNIRLQYPTQTQEAPEAKYLRFQSLKVRELCIKILTT